MVRKTYHDTDTEDGSYPSPTSWHHNSTLHTYNTAGQLTHAYVKEYTAHNVTFTNDENGQIIRRDETVPLNAPSGQTGAPHEVYYRFGGRQMGYTSNNGTSDLTASAAVAERGISGGSTPGTFRNGSAYASPYADFIQSYDPLNTYNQGSGAGYYIVRGGETLQAIAQQIYGDANLWYKIAEANGLTGTASLSEGQRLRLPAGVARNSFNADTIKPYDASEAVGDLTPAATKPPKKPKCGGLGMILVAVIAIAVTAIVTAGVGAVAANVSLGQSLGAVFGGAGLTGLGATTAGVAGATVTTAGLGAAGAIGAGVVGAAVGSAVSQGFAIATDIQDKFSWKGVGLAALSAGIGAGLSGADIFGKIGLGGNVAGSAFVGNVARGALTSAVSQSVGRITGLQSKFSWAGVAATGVGAGIGAAAAGGNLGTAANAIANAATRSAIEGTSFGRNLIAAIPDVVASHQHRPRLSAVRKKSRDKIAARTPLRTVSAPAWPNWASRCEKTMSGIVAGQRPRNVTKTLTGEGQDDERCAGRSTLGSVDRYCRRGGDAFCAR